MFSFFPIKIQFARHRYTQSITQRVCIAISRRLIRTAPSNYRPQKPPIPQGGRRMRPRNPRSTITAARLYSHLTGCPREGHFLWITSAPSRIDPTASGPHRRYRRSLFNCRLRVDRRNEDETTCYSFFSDPAAQLERILMLRRLSSPKAAAR